MFDIPQAVTALHRFAQNHNQSLQHAALLLGGRNWLLRTQRLLDDLSQPMPLEARVIREATALLSLLALDNVHHMDSIEAACFAMIDPANPCVEEICLLTEALEQALAEVESPPVPWGHQNAEWRV